MNTKAATTPEIQIDGCGLLWNQNGQAYWLELIVRDSRPWDPGHYEIRALNWPGDSLGAVYHDGDRYLAVGFGCQFEGEGPIEAAAKLIQHATDK